MTNSELKSKNMSEVNKKAWVYKKAGKTWSEAMKQAWDDVTWGMDFEALAVGPVQNKPVKTLPLQPWANGDIAAYREGLKRSLGIPA
jgi:hypothetical protein